MKKELRADSLVVRVHDTREEMGQDAAREVSDQLRRVLARKGSANLVFAAAPSQNEFLAALRTTPGLDWSRVNAFHLDEYLGLPADAPQSFGRFLREMLFDWVRPGKVHYLDGQACVPQAECERYAGLLADNPLDIACIGIGENGHLAFNDPPVADFRDPHRVKVVKLEERCRLQQVHDGCFRTLADVPTHALTLTIPAIMAAEAVFCVVPGPTKQEAVKQTLEGPVSTGCPASILRRHPRAVLFLDLQAASRFRRIDDGS